MKETKLIYHIYPLGMCKSKQKISEIANWIPYFKDLKVNTVLFGPVFESRSHGYDTTDYFKIDRRLGSNEDFSYLTKTLNASGLNIILDGVFNHVGRDFFAFKDVLQNRENSKYIYWFNINLQGNSPFDDGLYYDCWEGHAELVKLNLGNQEVKDHIFSAIKFWVECFGINGLRLDVAYCLDKSFLRELHCFCKQFPDFWLLGEMIHGDYRTIVNCEMLDSATNYEGYKAIFSSHNDNNYFEIAYSLNRCFGEGGLYKDLLLYNFVDNHDVTRLFSILKNNAHAYLAYLILLTIPGIPSIYYGSEFGQAGQKGATSDSALRPALTFSDVKIQTINNPLFEHIKKLSTIRNMSDALLYGNYQQLLVSNEQLIYMRKTNTETVIVAMNMSPKPVTLNIKNVEGTFVDLLNNEENIQINYGATLLIHSNWGRILRLIS